MIRLLALCVLLSALAMKGATAAPVAVPGTKVALEPPPGFTLADRFPGFQRADVNASIVVSEMPAPVAEIQQSMHKENLAKRNIVLLESHMITHAGADALLVKVSQQALGDTYLKWMLVTGDAQTTTLVVGTFRSDTETELSAPLRQAVLSTTLDAARPQDHFEGLLFRIEPSAKLKIAGRAPTTPRRSKT